MNKYNYTVKFKIDSNNNYRYNAVFTIEAESNKEAVVKGEEMWNERVSKSERLKTAKIVKITCRKKELERRRPKMSDLEKALYAANNYLSEELSK